MIHTQHSWVAFPAGVITCLAVAARVHAQSPVPTPQTGTRVTTHKMQTQSDDSSTFR